MPPRDARGVEIRVGDLVRVVRIPDLSGMPRRRRRESRPVFEHILGREKRVIAFNTLGWPELSFRIRTGPHAGLHTVWIEPTLVRVQPRDAGCSQPATLSNRSTGRRRRP